jgi:hypothetical protein
MHVGMSKKDIRGRLAGAETTLEDAGARLYSTNEVNIQEETID